MFNEADKEQIEQLKKLWHEYGRLLILAIVVGLAVGYGWQYWHKYQHERRQKAASLFNHFVNLENTGSSQQDKTLAELAKSYDDSAYASFAKMAQAANLIQQQHYDEALNSLQWVREHAKAKDLRDLASIREARLLLAMGRAQDSLNLLLKLHDSIYQPMAYELSGDAYAALGDSKKAANEYQKAQQAYIDSGAENTLANRKATSPVWVPNKPQNSQNH